MKVALLETIKVFQKEKWENLLEIIGIIIFHKYLVISSS